MHIIIFVTIMQNGTAALLSAASFFDNDSTTNELLMRPLFFEAGSGVSLWSQIKYLVQFFIDDEIKVLIIW